MLTHGGFNEAPQDGQPHHMLRHYKTLRIWPPSACNVAPVIYDAASENKKMAAAANSFGSP